MNNPDSERGAVAVAGNRFSAPAPRLRVRWRIFGLIFLFSLLAYLQQKSLTITSERMMPELELSQMQIGWLESAFVGGYAAFQLAGGVFGQWLGGRRAITIISLVAAAAMLAMPVAASLHGSTALFVALLSAQLTLGIAQAPLFPITAGILESWFPPRQWPIVLGLQTTGLQLGATLTAPLIAFLMEGFGWQRAVIWTTLPAFALIAVWAWYVRNTPEEHPAVGPQELAELGPDRGATVDPDISLRRVLALLKDRNVLLLSFGYVCMNYMFYLLANWCFLYLVQERHFTVLESGFLAALPPLAAALGAGAGGLLVALLTQRLGLRWGVRAVPLVALPLAGALLLLVVQVPSPYVAVAALAAAYGSIETTEAAFWTATMSVARADTMAACGALNTGGNLGGVIGIPIVAYLSGHHAWNAAFALGAVCAVISAATWLGVDATRPFAEHQPQGSTP
jgi:ACS family glucarate transporter-like MFS transporter